MDPITIDFEDDLNKICIQLDFIDTLKKFSGCAAEQPVANELNKFLEEALVVHEGAKKVHSNLPLVSGTLILYTCGRFESVTRTLFEDLCQRLVSRAPMFSRLPKKMRENLPIYTAKVIAEPRKYGHAEGGVRTFVTTLASNLAVDAEVTIVNHQCLSITDANMRPEVVAELFARVGADKIWTRISEQAAIKTYFEESDTAKVETKAKKKLNDLMELRNKIAHPSGELEWPSTDAVRDYVKFLKLTVKAISEQVGVYEVTLCSPDANVPS